ncbi:MAG: molybdate ABC transporter substrate-binding protein [Burkholderiaceae bacterium]
MKRRFITTSLLRPFAWMLAAASLTFSVPAWAEQITVYAAASLKESLDAIARQVQAQTGDKVVVSYAASSALAKQIENGAPADVFISADLDWMDYLAQRKLIQPASRKNLLANQLVLIAPANTAFGSDRALKIAPNFQLAARLGDEKLAMANPDSVPAGKYGKAALEHLNVWNAVSGKVARADNVRGALVLVARGEAPYGIVYRTDALADRQVVIVDTFPADSHAPIVYPVALTAASASTPSGAAAKRFLEYLQSAGARAVWQQYGFTMAK